MMRTTTLAILAAALATNVQAQAPATNAQGQAPGSNVQGQAPGSNVQGQAPGTNVQGQTSATNAQAQTSMPLSLGDEYFAMKAYADGTAEVAKSRLALERASNAGIRNFAQQLIRDHTECNNKIVELARAKRIPLPNTIDAVHTAAMNRLAGMSGSDFDKAFTMAQIGAHKEALLLFGHEAHKGQDQDLKSLAQQTIPVLEKHTQMAYEMAGENDEYQKFQKIRDYSKQVMGDK